MRESLRFSTVVRWCQRNFAWILPTFFGVLYFAYGFSQIHQYGVSWDEPLHRNWGELFMLFWSTGDRSYLESMPGFGIHYGPLFYAANYVLSEWLSSHHILSFVEANHVLTLLTASVSVGLTFVLGRLIGGFRIGFFAALSFMFFPQLLAHAQYNPKDIPLLTAVILTSIIFVTALKRGSVRLFLLAAFLIGVSISTKVTALFMAPVFGLTYVVWLLLDKKSVEFRTLLTQTLLLVGVVVLCVLGMYLFWPTAWGDLLLVPRSIFFFLTSNFWPGNVLYFGQQYAGSDLPWHYTISEFFAATPVLLVVGFIVGLLKLLYRIRLKKLSSERAFLLLWVLLPLVYTMKSGVVRYDGIRQFFFILPAVFVVMAVGIDRGLRALKLKYLQTIVVLFFVTYLAFQVSTVHPFEGSYRNEILQFLYPSRMDEQFDVEYWGATYKQGMEWLITHAELDSVICVPIADVLIEWYPVREDLTFECSARTNYVMFFTRHSPEAALLADTPVFTIERLGARLLSMYHVK